MAVCRAFVARYNPMFADVDMQVHLCKFFINILLFSFAFDILYLFIFVLNQFVLGPLKVNLRH